MKTKLSCSIKIFGLIAAGVLSLSPSSGHATTYATTYSYVGSPFTNQSSTDAFPEEFPDNSTANSCAFCGGSITGSVTFNFNTTGFSGSVSLAGGQISSLALGTGGSIPVFFLGANSSLYVSLPPPYRPNFYDVVPFVSGASFGLVDGSITSWYTQGGGTGPDQGPGTDYGFGFYSRSLFGDGVQVDDTAAFITGNASNSTDGVWNSDGVSTTPLPAALPLFATGLGALVLLGWRRKKQPIIVASLQERRTAMRG